MTPGNPFPDPSSVSLAHVLLEEEELLFLLGHPSGAGKIIAALRVCTDSIEPSDELGIVGALVELIGRDDQT
jgi:hypothetical protein